MADCQGELARPAESPLLPPFNRSVSLLAWGYNEERSIDAFLSRAAAMMEATVTDFEIVFVNDGSLDRTGELAEAVARRDPRVTVLHNRRNMNVGNACRRAILAASKEFLFWQTVDWSYDLSRLRTYLELLTHYDAVQGVRESADGYAGVFHIIRAIGRRSDNRTKAVISILNYLLVRLLFGVPFSDYQNVTFYRTRHLQSLPLEGRGSFLNPEMLIRSYAAGLRFIEVPIPFLPRREGRAKGTKPSSIICSLADILSAWWRWGLATRLRGRHDTTAIARSTRAAALPHPVRALLAELPLP